MITKWLNEEWLGKKSFRPTGGKYLVPKEKLSFKNHNVKPSSCRLVCASMTWGMKALISLPNTYTDTQTHECRWPHWQVTSRLGIQSSLQQRQGCRGPFGFVWSATSRLCPHTCRRWETWAWLQEREGTPWRDQSQETEKCTKTWIFRKEKFMAHTESLVLIYRVEKKDWQITKIRLCLSVTSSDSRLCRFYSAVPTA